MTSAPRSALQIPAGVDWSIGSRSHSPKAGVDGVDGSVLKYDAFCVIQSKLDEFYGLFAAISSSWPYY